MLPLALGALTSLTGGGGLSASGGPSRADASGGTSSGMFDNSGFTVNYAPSIGVGGGSMPSWVWIAAAVVGVIWLARR